MSQAIRRSFSIKAIAEALGIHMAGPEAHHHGIHRHNVSCPREPSPLGAEGHGGVEDMVMYIELTMSLRDRKSQLQDQ